jgi:hypothetical protein
MEKWLLGCGAAISGVNRVFDHEAPIGDVYYLRGRVRFSRSAQVHDILAFLHEARQAGDTVLDEVQKSARRTRKHHSKQFALGFATPKLPSALKMLR